MEELAILRDVTRRLDSAGVAYMLTGSLAMNFYAQPRMTRDIDMVVEVGWTDVDRLPGLFDDDYLVSKEAIREAVEHSSMFNIIHQASVIKIDLMIRKNEPYRRVEFDRRRRIRIGDDEVYVVSKEDLILSKLWWAKDSLSEMQLGDVRNLLETGYDEEYLEHWLHELGLGDLAKRFFP